jgi:hypothetical protein
MVDSNYNKVIARLDRVRQSVLFHPSSISPPLAMGKLILPAKYPTERRRILVS